MEKQTLVLVVAVLVLMAGALLWLRGRRRGGSSSAQRSKARSRDGLDTLLSWHPQASRILTAPERQAYRTLRTALPEHIILAQVALARFIKVPTRYSYSEWLRRVGVMCADLVVCDSESQVIAVVDIRESESQENDRARQRHARMDRVLKAAEIPLHVWREDAMPNTSTARSMLLDVSQPEQQPAPQKQPVRSAPATLTQPVHEGVHVEVVEPPSSTWFDDLDSAPVPLAPGPTVPRGSGPSIR